MNEGLLCSLPEVKQRELSADVDPRRAEFIRVIEKAWVNGTRLKYCFFDSARDGSPLQWDGDEHDKAVVQSAFNEWKNLGIGLEFDEVGSPSSAHIRIGFEQNAGSWSYIGKDALNQNRGERTMNFGWPLSFDAHGYDTALHEIGHALGSPHEHQNPNAGIIWNERAVYEELSGAPNHWSQEKIFHNVLAKRSHRDVEGSSWDPNSIMHYSFQSLLVNAPAPYSDLGIFPTNGLSVGDRTWIRSFYPEQEASSEYPELVAFESASVEVIPGSQFDFIIRPELSRKYKIETFGAVDTLLVLFEIDANEPIYLAGDDDSGEAYNAMIEHRLQAGKEYILRVRLYYASDVSQTAVMLY